MVFLRFFFLGWFVGLSLWISLVAFARAVGRVKVSLSFARGVGLLVIRLVCLLPRMWGLVSVFLFPVCGVWFWFVYHLPDMWAWIVWLACQLVSVGFCIGLMPLLLCL